MNDTVKDLEIAILHQISRAVLHEHNVSQLLKDVLDAMYREIGFKRGTFTLLRDDVLYIEASQGLTEEEIRRGKYHLGEGITGRVGEYGVPILIPDITKDPNFLNRTKTRGSLKNVAFLCVPIIHMEKVIGTLSMDREVTEETDLTRDMKLLETVANITADAVEICRQKHAEHEKLIAENQRLRDELDGCAARPPELIGNGGAMRAVYARIEQVAGTDAVVLIRGSAGTGKDLVARAIHRRSPRKNSPFVVLDCSAMPEALLERELSGNGTTPGSLHSAEGGTLFLDEVGALSRPLQLCLVNLLKEHARGEKSPDAPDVRIIAATSCDLENMKSTGAFREDLYYSLNIFPIILPDLRNRRSDIMLLAEHFLERYARLYGRGIRRISTPAINMMMSYHWPGNVRELENCMEHAVLNATGEVITGCDLPPSLQTSGTEETAHAPSEGKADFTTLVHSFERELIVDALKACRGNVSAAARALNITDRVIHYKIRKLHITPEWYKLTGE